jgi:hypothetical protein
MDAGVHLPQIEFAGEELSLRRLADTVDAARENGFATDGPAMLHVTQDHELL